MLASINRIETAFGTNLNVSSAGALGWMQFIPSSWEAYGVDANNDGRKDPYNPVDAICAAARYLNAAGGEDDLRTAIFAYNHADWYVDEVLLYARQYGKLPGDLITSLTGLTEGARFPVAADSRYADDISEREAEERAKPGKGAGNAADLISSSPTRRGIDIFSKENAPVVAVNDGQIKEIGENKKLGKYIVLEDTYGNRYTYAELGRVSEVYPVPKEKKLTAKDLRFVTGDDDDEAPDQASGSSQAATMRACSPPPTPTAPSPPTAGGEAGGARPAQHRGHARAPLRLPRAPQQPRPRRHLRPARRAARRPLPGLRELQEVLRQRAQVRPRDDGAALAARGLEGGRRHRPRPPRPARRDGPHVNFSIQPAGRGAPKIDPKPILDGWKLLEATAIYRAAGKNPFDGNGACIGQILLMSKEQLARRVVANPDIEFPPCDRHYILDGQIERRLLAFLEYLTARGFRLTMTSLAVRPRDRDHDLRQHQPPLGRRRRRHRRDQRSAGARQPGPRLRSPTPSSAT